MTAVRRLARLLEQWSGVEVERGGGLSALERYVHGRVAELGLASGDAYVDRLAGRIDPEVARLIDATTVGHTWLYRDIGQMEVVEDLVGAAGGPLQVWVPGCSTGADPYTVAMICEARGRPARIVGTDVNSELLEQAEQARFSAWAVRALPGPLARFVQPCAGERFEVVPGIRERVTFQRHNLVDAPVPARGGWDVVLCRNVLIYFRPDRALDVVERVGHALSPGGHLLLGAGELISARPRGLTPVRLRDRMAFQRAPTATATAATATAPSTPPASEAQAARYPTPTATPTPTPTAQRSGRDPLTPGPSRSPPAPLLLPGPTVPELVTAGNLALHAGNHLEALSCYAEALARDPLFAEARLFMGIAYHGSGDFVAAAGELRSALVLQPELWPASFYLALSHEKLGRPEDARREYRRVVETCERPLELRSRSPLLEDLAAWRRDVVTVARRRASWL